MANQERIPTQIESMEGTVKVLIDTARRHPEIAEKLEEIFVTLDYIIGNLDAENAEPYLVAKQLSAASILLDGVQTRGSDIGKIPETEVGVSMADSIAQSVRIRVANTRATDPQTNKWWRK